MNPHSIYFDFLLDSMPLARGLGRGIRNLIEGCFNGELWALAIVGLFTLVALALVAIPVINAVGAPESDDDVELTAEEKSLMNKF